jgi:hypothetical protein
MELRGRLVVPVFFFERRRIDRLAYPSDNSRRVFGLDFADHAQQAGFSVQTVYGSQLLNPSALARARILQSTVPVFLCRRPN